MINREIIYERTMTGSYMKIPEGMNPGLDERLMLKGKLKGTLSVEKTYMDGGGQYWYNISGKQSLDTYCRMKQIGIEFVERLVMSVCSELEILEWNLIHTNCLMLDPELIFITNSNHEFIFTLYPGNNTQVEAEFQQLMEYLLTKLDHRDESAVRAVYGIYEKTMDEGYSITDIRDFVLKSKQQEQKKDSSMQAVCLSVGEQESSADGRHCRGMRQDGVEKQNVQKSDGFVAKIWGYIQKKLEYAGFAIPDKHSEKSGHGFPKGKGGGRKGSEGACRRRAEDYALVYPEEEVSQPQEEIYPTVCLSAGRKAPQGMLLYQGTDRLDNISLGSRVVRIGHGKEADVRIDRDTISQLHARIDRDGDTYYIEDLNSTNGTLVNDEALVYKERRQLRINDIVRFADVSYRFC